MGSLTLLWAAAASPESASLNGAEVQAQVAKVLVEFGQVGGVRISPHRSYPACKSDLKVAPHMGSWQAVSVACPGDIDAPGWRRVLRVEDSLASRSQRNSSKHARVSRALILRESLARGTVLTSEHLFYGDAPGLGYDGLVLHLETAVGRQLKVNLGAGRALLARHIDHAWKVEEGAPVTITTLHGGVRIDTQGYADADGQLGQSIPVRNARSGTLVFGLVTGQNKVEVQPKMPAAPAVTSCGSGKNCGKR